MLKYYIFLIFILIATLVVLMPVTVRLRFSRDRADDHLVVYWRPFNLIPMGKMEIPLVQLRFDGFKPYLEILGEFELLRQKPVVKKEVEVKQAPWYQLPKIIQLTPELLVAAVHLASISRWFLRHVHCLAFQWKTEVGFADASATGIAVGALWAFKNLVLQQLVKYIRISPESNRINVIPDFNNPGLRTDFDCILTVRFGYIIIAGLRVLKVGLSLIKSFMQVKGVKVWRKIIQFNH
ncbi:MAG: DUF2953 domain-containing protein [Thermoanaerobacteraceae bacterium]|nr:DUF2953 domain-containing protein [Thermoanaerobacteraceae bacterium]